MNIYNSVNASSDSPTCHFRAMYLILFRVCNTKKLTECNYNTILYCNSNSISKHNIATLCDMFMCNENYFCNYGVL